MSETATRPDYLSAPRLLFQFRGSRTPLLAAAIGCGILSGVAELGAAWAVWRLVCDIVAGQFSQTSALNIAAIAFMSVVAKAMFFGMSTALAHLVAFGVIADIRMALGAKWLSTPVGRMATTHSAQAKTIALDHCEKLELFIAHALPETAAAVSVWSAVTIWLFLVDWRLALATAVLVPLAFGTMIHAMRSNGHRMGEWVMANSRMGAAVVDFVTAMPVIRVFNRIGDDHRRTADTVRANAQLQSDWGRAFVTWGAPFSTLTVSGIAVIAPVAAWLLLRTDVPADTVLLFLILGPTYPVPLVTVFYRLIQLPLLSTNAVEIEKELAAEVPISDQPAKIVAQAAAPATEPALEFDRVTFSYEPGCPVLDDISFRAAPGTVTALVGLSGAGKSTIGELALGFLAPDSGTVSINGTSISDLSEAQLYSQVAAVFQRPHLSAGTIRDNLLLSRSEASEAELHAATSAAAIDEFTGRLPNGIDTVLGESGSGLSGGQRQRVAIGRALVADRSILVLDEATAATDPDNEVLIQKGLAAATAGRTVLVIAHRLHTVCNADQILVLEGGRIIERGTHDQLMATAGHYATLWNTQEGL